MPSSGQNRPPGPQCGGSLANAGDGPTANVERMLVASTAMRVFLFILTILRDQLLQHGQSMDETQTQSGTQPGSVRACVLAVIAIIATRAAVETFKRFIVVSIIGLNVFVLRAGSAMRVVSPCPPDH
jgi:hypothetical protein